MKSIIQVASAILILGTSANGQCNLGSEVTIGGSCSHENIQQKTGCTLDKDQVEEACNAAGYSFKNISQQYYQFDKEFMDGNSLWNDAESGLAELEAVSESDRVKRFQAHVLTKQKVAWPEYDALDPFLQNYVLNGADREAGVEPQPSYMDNFNLTDSCDMGTGVGAVMCCFTADSTKADGLISDTDDNSDICVHDIHDSHKSSHIYRGRVEYDDETNTYCTGFAFDAMNDDANNQYKANLLAYTSFVNTAVNGYKGAVPGAPMCSCIEKMPTVTDASCTKVSVDTTVEQYKVTPTADGISVSNDHTTSIRFEPCGSTLKEYIETTYPQVPQVKLDKQLVGDGGCDAARVEARNDNVWVTGEKSTTQWINIDESNWKIFAGYGYRLTPFKNLRDPEYYDEEDEKFRAMLPDPPFIIRRVCDSCKPSHRDIYYKRLTEIPTHKNITVNNELVEVKYNFLENFLDRWREYPSNKMGAANDFTLHSSYEEAKTGDNAWTYCRYNGNSNYGFPYACGPTGWVSEQWNAYAFRNPSHHKYSAYDNAFMIDISTSV